MALTRKKQEQTSEATIVLSISVTDILKVPSDEEKANKQIEAEIKRLTKALQKISGVDNIDIQKTKIFPNIKTESSTN